MPLNEPIANGRMSYARRRGDCFPAWGDRVEYWPVVLVKTIELQAEIDRVIATASGFPAAFQ